jgi:hypothetical protein
MMHATRGYSQTLTVRVVDERDTGIYSRVFYEDGTQPRPFWNTDQKGEIQRPHPCGKTRTLKAHPFDTGTYFDSEELPCASKVILRVLKRETPKGLAVNFQIVPITLPDGSPGVVTVKAALAASSVEVDKTKCEITLQAIADQQAFKVDGDHWISIKRGSTAFSQVFGGALQPDLQVVTVPYGCAATGGRLMTLQERAVDRLDKSFLKGGVMTTESLRSLGIQ